MLKIKILVTILLISYMITGCGNDNSKETNDSYSPKQENSPSENPIQNDTIENNVSKYVSEYMNIHGDISYYGDNFGALVDNKFQMYYTKDGTIYNLKYLSTNQKIEENATRYFYIGDSIAYEDTEGYIYIFDYTLPNIYEYIDGDIFFAGIYGDEVVFFFEKEKKFYQTSFTRSGSIGKHNNTAITFSSLGNNYTGKVIDSNFFILNDTLYYTNHNFIGGNLMSYKLLSDFEKIYLPKYEGATTRENYYFCIHSKKNDEQNLYFLFGGPSTLMSAVEDMYGNAIECSIPLPDSYTINDIKSIYSLSNYIVIEFSDGQVYTGILDETIKGTKLIINNTLSNISKNILCMNLVKIDDNITILAHMDDNVIYNVNIFEK